MTIDNILSVIAILISIGSVFYNNYSNGKVTEKTLNKDFFKNIYFEYIINKIPEAVMKLEAKSDSATNECNNLNDLIHEVIDASTFYRYFDNEFYEDLLSKLIELDELTISASEPKISSSTFRKYKEDIHKSFNSLYTLLKTYYSKI
ncbi:Uncharacterised protein [[Clostridium] sordellii]|uniref:Lipoprotein n=2 Tax=Paraclostridium sordellii TaxID=1505 RepID=A0ABM9RU41_PARSO|nr:hypothetical protein [Paeniclostridium sordellii]EPZ62120.1 hypothetical protein H477_5692 [[Clostridium] sordellii ATCC 9714] [Paeniclostridium sordellii ATCC 9714]CEJ75418.1 hypothetical protein ATCC9714_PCS200111 (plasmid) [[Clostridium] sordellii] [Paeniclostridium sordellii]CEN68010.1 Uncharacterised protein [[Clostridium] sordellii] [Paeniclostridium sordellii]CEN71299.1 Uncharacterised protein [[Clostridium] sordellii] [Paeniclostridium sordellii]CEO20857.1 Uncharacterised protein [[